MFDNGPVGWSLTAPLRMRVESGKECRKLLRVLVSALLRALAAISLVLLPLAAPPVAIAAGPDHVETVADHCDGEEQQGDEAGGMKRHCASCAAVPALDAGSLAGPPVPMALIVATVPAAMLGLELELATPPPRLA